MNVRSLPIAAVSAVLMSLGFSSSSYAIGEITCETWETAVNGGSSSPPDSEYGAIREAFVQEGGSVETKFPSAMAPDDRLFDCLLGAMPPLSALRGTAGSAPTQAYIEHNLVDHNAAQGFSMQLELPLAIASDERIQLSMLAIDFNTPDSLGEQFRLSVQRAPGSASGALVLSRVGSGAMEIGRLPLAAGTHQVQLSWPTDAQSELPFAVSVGGVSLSAALAAYSRPLALRVGYLGVDAPGASNRQIWLSKPNFRAD